MNRKNMIINVDNGKIDKECILNRSYACCGCEHYYDESDTICKRGCIHYVRKLSASPIVVIEDVESFEVKEMNLEKESLTWEDIRELYIIFAEVDAEIELSKVDIKSDTIGYYQEVLKRFKAQKGE